MTLTERDLLEFRKNLDIVFHNARQLNGNIFQLRNKLYAICKSEFGHKPKCALSVSAVCEICGEDLGWWCEKSPIKVCVFDGNSEYCIYCGGPQERK